MIPYLPTRLGTIRTSLTGILRFVAEGFIIEGEVLQQRSELFPGIVIYQ